MAQGGKIFFTSLERGKNKASLPFEPPSQDLSNASLQHAPHAWQSPEIPHLPD